MSIFNRKKLNSRQKIVQNSLKEYFKQKIDYTLDITDYDSFGDYFNWSRHDISYPYGNYLVDKNGIPKVRYGEEYSYNPVTTVQHGIILYGKILKGEKNKEDLIPAINKLLTMQDEDGSFRYRFQFKYYLADKPFEPGWTSAMAQGNVLSLLTRAYSLIKDKNYVEVGNKAFKFLTTPVDQGGVMFTLKDLHSLYSDDIIFEEYPVSPASYTLNGFVYTLLGLYDWAELNRTLLNNPEHKAGEYFQKGLNSLIKILPCYDIGGFTAYDLGHITYNKNPHVGINYHAVHIAQMNALYTITGDKIFKYYRDLWISYTTLN